MSGNGQPSLVGSSGRLSQLWQDHDNYAKHADKWTLNQKKNGDKILLWSVIKSVLETSDEQNWGEGNSELPARSDLESQLNDEFDAFSDDMVTKRNKLEKKCYEIWDKMSSGVIYSTDQNAIFGARKPDYSDFAGTSFVHEMVDLTYEKQVTLMAKLTTLLNISGNGKQLLAKLVHPHRGPLNALVFFDPPSKDLEVKKVTSNNGVKLVATRSVVRSPKDEDLFEEQEGESQLAKFSGTGAELTRLGTNLLPGVAQLIQQGEGEAAAVGLGYILGGFTNDKQLSDIANLNTPLSELQDGNKGDPVTEGMLTTLSSALVQGWGLVNEIADSSASTVGHGALKLLMSGASLITRLFGHSQSAFKKGMGLLADISGIISTIYTAIEEYKPEDAAVRYLLPSTSSKWLKIAAWAGPVSDVVGAANSIKAAIGEAGHGDSYKAAAKAVGAVGAVASLAAGIAAASGVGIPALAAFGIACMIGSLVWDWQLGEKSPVAAWMNHTYFGNAHHKTYKVNNPYFNFQSKNEENYLRQVGAYFGLMKPLADTGSKTRQLNHGQVPGEGGDVATAKIAHESAAKHSPNSGKVFAGTLKVPVIAGGSGDSKFSICPVESYGLGLTNARWGARHLFDLPDVTVGSWDPAIDENLTPVKLGLSGITSLMQANHYLSDFSSDLNSFDLRLEGTTPRQVFGFTRNELRNGDFDPCLRIRHITPKVQARITRYTNSTKPSEGESWQLYRLAPTSYVPISHNF
jgi:hypothetical protein